MIENLKILDIKDFSIAETGNFSPALRLGYSESQNQPVIFKMRADFLIDEIAMLMQNCPVRAIPRCYGLIEIDGEDYFAFELKKGESLRSLLQNSFLSGKAALSKAALKAAAEAMNDFSNYAGKKILHMDLKPEHILLDENYHFTALIDFACACFAAEEIVLHKSNEFYYQALKAEMSAKNGGEEKIIRKRIRPAENLDQRALEEIYKKYFRSSAGLWTKF